MLKRTILTTSFFFSATQLLGAVVALFINILLARFFGASKTTDAFVIVFGFMMVVLALVKGAFLSNFTPHYISLKEQHGKDRAVNFVLAFLVVVFVVMMLVVTALYFLRDEVISIIALSYKNDPYFMGVAEDLYILLLPFVVTTSINAVFSSLLISEKQVIFATINGLTQNIFAILGLLIGYQTLGIRALALGYVVGVIFNSIGFFIYSALAHGLLGRLRVRSIKEMFLYFKKNTSVDDYFFLVKKFAHHRKNLFKFYFYRRGFFSGYSAKN